MQLVSSAALRSALRSFRALQMSTKFETNNACFSDAADRGLKRWIMSNDTAPTAVRLGSSLEVLGDI
jgi:hypothetical protein